MNVQNFPYLLTTDVLLEADLNNHVDTMNDN